jgi:hypothetical protein
VTSRRAPGLARSAVVIAEMPSRPIRVPSRLPYPQNITTATHDKYNVTEDYET